MGLLVHGVFFLAAGGVLWLSSRVLVDSIDRYAKRNHRERFVVAFFVLGLVTSISEFSVGINSLVRGVPEVSAGNLLGASFVILFLIIPLLAIGSRQIALSHTLSRYCAFIAIAAVGIPTFLSIDGEVTVLDGVLALIAYSLVIICMYRMRNHADTAKKGASLREQIADLLKVLIAALFIFIAGHYLVEETIYFAGALSLPASLIGLLVLSIGTNVPELTIAVRSIMQKRAEIAFGDYLGSALTNTLIFGVLPLFSGSFAVSIGSTIGFAVLFAIGVIFFFLFTQTKRTISRTEGFVLLAFYVSFVMLQAQHVAYLAR